MDSWLFKIVDNAKDIVVVLGVGETVADAEASAIGKWEAALSGRDDYQDRLPAVIESSVLTTVVSLDELPDLIV